MKAGILLMLIGAAAWYWIISGVEMKSGAQWAAAVILLYLFVAPGIQVTFIDDRRAR